MTVAAPSPPVGSPPSVARRIFFGSHGPRAGWRLALFYAITLAVSIPIAVLVRANLGAGEERPLTIELLLLVEAVFLGATMVALVVLRKIEGRSFADWGIPLRPFPGISGRRFLEGAAWAVATTALLAAVLASVGAYRVAGTNAAAPGFGRAAALWLLGTLLIALHEEVSFRGYQLATLADGLGWWPAAILLALFFGFVLHYLEKPNETLLDGLNVSLVALFFAESVRRTGSIAFATGWHFAFNFVVLFLLGSPNTAFAGAIEPHWLRASFAGPEWLTGGATGLEASAVATALFLLGFAALAWRFPLGRAGSG